MRALVIGHFSTVGDVESLEYVEDILDSEGIGYDVLPYKAKLSASLEHSLSLRAVDPSNYTHLIAVCGPIWPELLARSGITLDHFAHCTWIGVNLTMVRPVHVWNPFHVLLERDSSRTTRPDITFLKHPNRVTVAGICTITRQREYGFRQRHAQAVSLLRQLVDARELAAIEIDTRWPKHRNSGGLTSPDQVMSLVERVDVLLTNRLHGMVYALRAGVPALALDPVLGGDKVVAQGKVLEWPAVSTVEAASLAWLEHMLDWCLSAEGRMTARSVAERARARLGPSIDQLRAALRTTFDGKPPPPPSTSSGTGLVRRLAAALWR